MIIYKTTNTINGKIYIGQSIRNDENYLGSGYRLCLAINKYGRENFKKDIIEECESYNLDEREIYWISYFNSTDEKIGYNILEGGQNREGIELPNHVKEKISNSLKDFHLKNPEFSKDIVKNRRSYSGENNPNFGNGEKIKGSKNGRFDGNGTTNETREKIRQSKLGSKPSQETKDIWSSQRKGEKNGMYGKSSYTIWVEKYGIDEANRMKEEKTNKMLLTRKNNKEKLIVDSIALAEVLLGGTTLTGSTGLT